MGIATLYSVSDAHDFGRSLPTGISFLKASASKVWNATDFSNRKLEILLFKVARNSDSQELKTS